MFCKYRTCFTKTCLCVNVFHMRNISLNMTVSLRLRCLSHHQRRIKKNKKWTNKVCTSSLNDGKNLCYAVCLLSKPSGGGFDWDVIPDYISNNLRVPSVTRAANSSQGLDSEQSSKVKRNCLVCLWKYAHCVYFTFSVTQLWTWPHGCF